MKPITEYMKQASNFHFHHVVNEYFSKEKISSMPIDEYLSTKVVKPMVKFFLNKPKFDEVKSFLLDHGFKEYDLVHISYATFADLTERRFGVYKTNIGGLKYAEVTICDKGTTTKDNPEFTLFTTDDGSLFFAENKSTGEKFIAKEETYNEILRYFHTYEEFLDRINDHISWNDY